MQHRDSAGQRPRVPTTAVLAGPLPPPPRPPPPPPLNLILFFPLFVRPCYVRARLLYIFFVNIIFITKYHRCTRCGFVGGQTDKDIILLLLRASINSLSLSFAISVYKYNGYIYYPKNKSPEIPCPERSVFFITLGGEVPQISYELLLDVAP